MDLPIRSRLAPWAFGLAALLPMTTPGQQGYTLGKIVETRELVLELGIGEAEYTEDVTITPTKSEWDSTVVSVAGAVVFKEPRAPLFRLQGSFWGTDEDVETWRESGRVVQRNDLQVSGFEMGADIGWQIASGAKGFLRGWSGLAYRFQLYERSSFRVLNDPGFVIGKVDEDYDIGLIRAELEGGLQLHPAWALDAGVLFGYAVVNQADNDLLGTIDGDGGFVLDWRIDLRWQVNRQHAASIGIRVGIQELDGEVQQQGTLTTAAGAGLQRIVEWPDNDLNLTQMAIRWTYLF